MKFPETDFQRMADFCRAAQGWCVAPVKQTDQPAGWAIALHEGDYAAPTKQLVGHITETSVLRDDFRLGKALAQPVGQMVGTIEQAPAGKRPGRNDLRPGQR